VKRVRGMPATTPIAAAALLLFAVGRAAAADTLEYPIKATYLYKFVPFVQWPEAAFPSADSPINICISGQDPFGPMLDEAAAGQRVGARPIAIRHIAAVDANSGCQVVYIGGSQNQSIAQGLQALQGQPVLTVTDNTGAPNDHGIVSFVVIDNRVRFEIDERAAAQNHLTISSKLLSLAVAAGQSY
jgi:hypothetical protein